MKGDLRIFVLVCVLLGGMGQGVVAPKLPELLQGSSELALASGLSATLMYLGIFLSTFRFGRWADQGRTHWLLAPGLFAYAAILLTLGLVREPAAVFAARFAEGLALSAIFVAADFVLGRLSAAHERGQWLSYYGVALSAGLVLGPLTSLGAGKLGPSPMIPLAIVSSLALLLGAASLSKRVPKVDAPTDGDPDLRQGALAAASAYGYRESGLVAVFPILATTSFHVAPEYCLLVVIACAAVSSVFWGVASDRKGSRPIVIGLLALLFVGPTALGAASQGARLLSGASLAYVSCALFGILAGGLYPVGFSWLLERLPESSYGYASGAFARSYGLGSLLGPMLTGYASQRWGILGLFASMSCVGALGLGAALLLREQRPPAHVT